MKNSGTLISLLGGSCLAAFAAAAPAEAKPCCHNDGRYYNVSSSTCHRYGGEVVPQRYCRAGRYGYDHDGRGDVSFAFRFGDVIIAYSDGYYDRHRRWHRWRNDREREWFRRHHGRSYHHIHHDRDHDRRRRDWRDGRRDDWD